MSFWHFIDPFSARLMLQVIKAKVEISPVILDGIRQVLIEPEDNATLRWDHWDTVKQDTVVVNRNRCFNVDKSYY